MMNHDLAADALLILSQLICGPKKNDLTSTKQTSVLDCSKNKTKKTLAWKEDITFSDFQASAFDREFTAATRCAAQIAATLPQRVREACTLVPACESLSILTPSMRPLENENQAKDNCE